jgi:hypothetical protein
VLTALNQNDIDELIEVMYPPVDPNAPPAPETDPAVNELTAAAQDFRQAVEALREAFLASRSDNGLDDIIDMQRVRLTDVLRG